MKRIYQLTTTLLLAILISAISVASFPALASQLQSRTVQRVVVNTAPQNVTDTGATTITPTLSFMTLNNDGVLTLTLSSDAALEGDTLMIAGEVTTDTNIQVANTSLSSVEVISQNDTVEFKYVNSQWVLVNSQNNAAD